MRDFVLNMLCTLGCGLVLTYGVKSLYHSAKQCYHWVWAPMGFFQQKSYSNRLLIEISVELSGKVIRSQFNEIWVLWGSCLLLCGCLPTAWAASPGKSGIAPHRHRLRSELTVWARTSSPSLKLRPRHLQGLLPVSVFVVHFLLSLGPSRAAPSLLLLFCPCALWFSLFTLPLCSLSFVIFLPSLASHLLFLFFLPVPSSLNCLVL